MQNLRKIIIDCDPGIDDSLALMLASKQTDLDILGVTTTAGNIEVEQGAQNALNILKLMGREDVPVYVGSAKPLVREPVFAKETHGENGVGGVKLKNSTPKAGQGAVDFLYQTLMDNSEVTLLALGPLTNIAKLITRYPEVKSHIKELVLMGGNFKSHGNCTPVAEFNFWFDPDAAKIVFEELGRPIIMTGLDVTRQILFTPDLNEKVRAIGTEVSDTFSKMVDSYNKFHLEYEGIEGSVLNDPLALAYFLDPSLCEGIDAFVQIIIDGPAIGMSMVDEYGILKKKPNCKVLTKVDVNRFFEFFLNGIFPDKIQSNEESH